MALGVPFTGRTSEIMGNLRDCWRADLRGLSSNKVKTWKTANMLVTWNERNAWVFNNTSSIVTQIFGRIMDEARRWHDAGISQLDRIFHPS